MKSAPAVFLALSAIAVSACVNHSINSEYADEKSPQSTNGVVYALAKTRLNVSITYTVSTSTTYKNGWKSVGLPEPSIKAPVVVSAIVAGDQNNRFIAKSDDLTDAAILGTTFKIQVGPEQLITSLSAETSDKSGEVLTNVIGGAISAAKILAIAGQQEEPDQSISSIQAAIRKIDAEIATLASGNDSQKIAKIKTLTDEKKVLVDFLANYQDINKTTVEEKQVTYSELFDLDDKHWTQGETVLIEDEKPCNVAEEARKTSCKELEGNWKTEISAPFKFLGVSSQDVVPIVVLTVRATNAQHVRTNAVHSTLANKEGILYRVPDYLHIEGTVKGSNDTILNGYLPIMQAGTVATLEAKSKSFTKRNTTITFDPQNGTLKEFGLVTESSAAASTKAISDSLGSVQSAVAELRKAQEEKEKTAKTEMAEQTASVKEQTDLVNAQLALIEAQRKLEAAQSPQATSP